MNIPNYITSSRLVLTAVFIAAISSQSTWANLLALVTFVIASVSDWFDGYYARKLNLVTPLGALLDPLADKILVASGFVYLSSCGYCPAWATCLIISREFIVTGLRLVAVEQGFVIQADRLGKWKTTFQLIFITTCLTHISASHWQELNWFTQFLFKLTEPFPGGYIMSTSFWVAIGLTSASGVNYILKNQSMFRSRD